MKNHVIKGQFHSDNRGFSLVEIIITMAILIIISIPVTKVFVQASRQNYNAYGQKISTSVGENLMEALSAYDYDEIWELFGPSGAPIPGFAGVTKIQIDQTDLAISPSPLEGQYLKRQMVLTGVQQDGADTKIYDIFVELNAKDGGYEAMNQSFSFATLTEYNPMRDYMFVQGATDETVAVNNLNNLAGATPIDPAKIQRDLVVTIKKNPAPDLTISVKTEMNYSYNLGGSTIKYELSPVYREFSYADAPDPSDSTKLADDAFRDVYVLFYPNYAKSASVPYNDKIQIINEDNLDCRVILIKQKNDDTNLDSKEMTYTPTLRVKENDPTVSKTHSLLCTNMDKNLGDTTKTVGAVNYVIEGISGVGKSQVDLLQTTTKNRLYSITLKLYESGAYDATTKVFDEDKFTGTVLTNSF